MANIDLNEKTAQELTELASANGVSVDEYVRTHLLKQKNDSGDSARSLLGSLGEESDLVDEVLSDIHVSRENTPFRITTDE